MGGLAFFKSKTNLVQIIALSVCFIPEIQELLCQYGHDKAIVIQSILTLLARNILFGGHKNGKNKKEDAS